MSRLGGLSAAAQLQVSVGVGLLHCPRSVMLQIHIFTEYIRRGAASYTTPPPRPTFSNPLRDPFGWNFPERLSHEPPGTLSRARTHLRTPIHLCSFATAAIRHPPTAPRTASPVRASAPVQLPPPLPPSLFSRTAVQRRWCRSHYCRMVLRWARHAAMPTPMVAIAIGATSEVFWQVPFAFERWMHGGAAGSM